MKPWVPMGSPLNHELSKPVWTTGLWINGYSMRDPVDFLDMYPDGLEPDWFPIYVPRTGIGLIGHPQVDVQVNTTAPGMTAWSIIEHGAYWTDRTMLNA